MPVSSPWNDGATRVARPSSSAWSCSTAGASSAVSTDAFSGIEDGACTTDFVQGLVGRRLATCERFDRYAQLIRLSSGLLYDAIGEPHSRLQRAADPALVTQRLMTLDVLMRYRDHPCLATAEEKRRFFTEVFGVPERDLPSRTYHSPNPGVPPTTQYFVDRVPILLGGDTTVVRLCRRLGSARALRPVPEHLHPADASHSTGPRPLRRHRRRPDHAGCPDVPAPVRTGGGPRAGRRDA